MVFALIWKKKKKMKHTLWGLIKYSEQLAQIYLFSNTINETIMDNLSINIKVESGGKYMKTIKNMVGCYSEHKAMCL